MEVKIHSNYLTVRNKANGLAEQSVTLYEAKEHSKAPILLKDKNDETKQYEADSQSREYAFPSGGDPGRQKGTLLSLQGLPPQERKQL